MKSKVEICRNCGTKFYDNFCGNCGQKKYHRIDRKYFMDEVQYIVLHTNKGFFYTLKNILINPGKTAREYIDGKRVKHYKPILLAFVLSGLSVFLSHYVFKFDSLMDAFAAKTDAPLFMKSFFDFFMKWYSFIALLFLPIFSLATYLAFRKWGHNFYEHVMMNAFFMSLYTLIHTTIFSVLLYLFPDLFNVVSVLIFGSIPFLLFWFYKGIYPEQRRWKIVRRILVFAVIFVLFYFVISIVSGFLFALISPESLREF